MKRTTLLCLAICLLAPLPVHAAKKVSAGSQQAVVSGNTQFAVDLYARLRSEKGNLFFSPYSISTALAMTSAGARGKTLQQMQDTLHFPAQDKLHPAAGQLIAQINGGKDAKKRGYQLSTANALWGQKGFPFRSEFLQLTRKHYGAGLRLVDFAKASEKSRQTINAWVEKETQNKIKDLMKKGTITGDTRLVLTNAIYFKGDWYRQFKKDRTRQELFHTADSTKVKVPMMHQTERFGYFETPQLQGLEMPYIGKDLSMVVLLPRKGKSSLPQLEKSLTRTNLNGWLRRMGSAKVAVSFPRFKMTSEFSLKKQLSEMGMPIAFTRAADFSAMHQGRSLFISHVVHKAFVAVDEKGTEAAAATGVGVVVTSAPIVRVFRADHPFLFLIRDKRSGSILFMGRLNNPKN